jgi:hypothetical protein
MPRKYGYDAQLLVRRFVEVKQDGVAIRASTLRRSTGAVLTHSVRMASCGGFLPACRVYSKANQTIQSAGIYQPKI